MRNHSPANQRLLARLALGVAVCIAFGTLAGAAHAADPPAASKGELAEITDTTAVIEFQIDTPDAKGLDVAVFYGRSDGGWDEDGWDYTTGPLQPAADKELGDYTVKIEDLKPDKTYFYRVLVKTADGAASWSEPGEIVTKPTPTPAYVYALRLLAVLAMLILPFAVGNWLAGRWRMPDYGWKLGVIFFALVWGIFFVSTCQLKLGIDLSGGVVLVYELEDDKEAAPKPDEADDQEQAEEDKAKTEKRELNELVGALALRVDPGGTRNVDIREYGADRIQVVIPRANPEEVRRIRDKLTSAGSLVFRILADTRDHRHKTVIALARQTDQNTVMSSDGAEVEGWWVPIRPGEIDLLARDQFAVTRTANVRGKETFQVLIVNDPYNVTGEYLSNCTAGHDMEKGRPCVFFNFDSTGAHLFGEFTGANEPASEGAQQLVRKLGIVLDGTLYSAPGIQEKIRGRGRITGGDFTDESVQDLVDVLNAGSLPTALKKTPISELTSGPALGSDTIRRGKNAIILSLAFVLVFMLIYYRFAGVVACGALLMNLVLLLGIMMALKVDFTLPGIAGLVLTVGMAVDANVLIFERIREELAKDAALRMAIRNGFGRALSAIVDANLTTLITATLLWFIGTPQIKGFAVVLWLGVVLSMFTAIFCSRVVFDIAERRRWIKRLPMRHLIGQTNIDFVGMRKIGMAVSATLILIGVVSVIGRGKGLLDIDFTGGEEIQILFDEPQDIEILRKTLRDAKDAEGEPRFPDLAVTDTALRDEGTGRRFVVTTSKEVPETDEGVSATRVVEGDLKTTFAAAGLKLATNKMTIGEISKIGGAPKAEPAPEQPADEPKPAENQQTRNDLPPPTVLAFAGPTSDLLAQADPPADPSEKAPAEAAPAEASPVEESPAEATKQPEAAAPAEPPAAEPAKETTPATDAPAETDTPPETVRPAKRDRFEGGTKVELTFEHGVDHDWLETLIDKQVEKLGKPAFELSNDSYEPGDSDAYENWVLRINMPAAELREKVLQPIEKEMAATPHFPSSSSIGGKVAGDMQQKAIYALLGSLICIVGYLWVRFQRVSYGLAAVVALVHDVMLTLGALAISAYLAPMLDTYKISLSVLAAFLTIIGYSLNDTIVVFDRIREVKGKSPQLTGDMINTSINQTLSRTLLTSLTTFLVVVVLFFGGGSGLHAFAYALMIGVIVGTYSSIFVASPVLYWMNKSSAAGNGNGNGKSGGGKK